MPISDLELKECIHRADFPLKSRTHAFKVIHEGLQSYREHRNRRYYGPSGKTIKKPTAAHTAELGRHDQKPARFVLIAALCRAWLRGFGVAPTLNHKHDPDSAFFEFAQDVLAREGIGRIHMHVEEYWSYVSNTVK